jgi:RNA polymerase sigma-70 factor, ECF subfamily
VRDGAHVTNRQRTGDTRPGLPCSSNGSVNDEDVEQLCVRYGPMVLRRCRRLLRHEDDARDACQDVFVRVVVSRERLDTRFAASLLYRIATNVCLNRIRDRRNEPAPVDDERLRLIAGVEDPSGVSDARLLLERLFGRHPESSRTMAVLHYVDGLTPVPATS